MDWICSTEHCLWEHHTLETGLKISCNTFQTGAGDWFFGIGGWVLRFGGAVDEQHGQISQCKQLTVFGQCWNTESLEIGQIKWLRGRLCSKCWACELSNKLSKNETIAVLWILIQFFALIASVRQCSAIAIFSWKMPKRCAHSSTWMGVSTSDGMCCNKSETMPFSSFPFVFTNYNSFNQFFLCWEIRFFIWT